MEAGADITGAWAGVEAAGKTGDPGAGSTGDLIEGSTVVQEAWAVVGTWLHWPKCCYRGCT